MSADEIREFMAHVSHWGMLRQVSSADGLDLGVFEDQYANIETLKAACAEWLSYRSQAAELTALRARTVPVRTPTSALFAPLFRTGDDCRSWTADSHPWASPRSKTHGI
ncbi:hypothetical protein [Brevibacterium sp. FME17]|uniref:hypothetical protein n=1 Tax=Brevibacterium sp. FME17 TaxID=2742606 RepID=UPI001868991A|nr:hypothetical protein [Brevibacterium sp. FME17]